VLPLMWVEIKANLHQINKTILASLWCMLM
jgi:hypothetical protein